MNVMYQIIEQSSLHGMSNWIKTLAIAVFSFIAVLLAIMLVSLLINYANTSVTLGYLYE
ncbi:hypothetical protein I2486_20205 [Cellulophaga sp. E16_2]|uniref:hypothetical protein n=1 Tax=unclassified Cellulophaga TaxID=2634405 RepID=UPI0013FD995C|nr:MULTISPECIES: hypothetical protein [unclassified Cellulophaga]MBO0593730.1 hypothetical protein [Cellulophaga sp. E16_2]